MGEREDRAIVLSAMGMDGLEHGMGWRATRRSDSPGMGAPTDWQPPASRDRPGLSKAVFVGLVLLQELRSQGRITPLEYGSRSAWQAKKRRGSIGYVGP